MDDAETTTTLVHAAPPTVTLEPEKPVPVMVIGVPPAVVPEDGETSVTEVAAAQRLASPLTVILRVAKYGSLHIGCGVVPPSTKIVPYTRIVII